jgi:hypothetical protein
LILTVLISITIAFFIGHPPCGSARICDDRRLMAPTSDVLRTDGEEVSDEPLTLGD